MKRPVLHLHDKFSEIAPAEARETLAPWFHNLHLPDGSQTAPDHPYGDFPRFKWRQIAAALPDDLSGWTALDIGCNAGFYSFELARRGAQVIAIDSNAHYLRQARWAAGQYGLRDRIQFYQMQVYELIHQSGEFDLVLFMGVFYHLRYPLLALDIVCRKVRNKLLFQTLTMAGKEVYDTPKDLPLDDREALARPDWPRMAFVEHRMANDPTNWWVPNHAGVEAMLRSCAMRVLESPGDEIYLCEPDRSGKLPTHDWNQDEFLAATGLNRRKDPAGTSHSQC